MKIWLDDTREAPVGWEWVQDFQSAIFYLRMYREELEAVSLDHDLGGTKTGYDVICWMDANNIWTDDIRIHSMNPVGRQRIQQVIDKHVVE